MLALLLLIVFEDVFNQEIYVIARNETSRHPIKALYTCHLKGMAWDLVEFLDKRYEWEREGKPLSFANLFCKLVGLQAACLAILRELYTARKLARTDDNDGADAAKNTKTLRTELGYIVKRDERINVAYQAVSGNPTVLSPLFDFDWSQTLVKPADKPKQHKVKDDKYFINLGACSRDRRELERMTDEDPPEDIQLPYYNLS
jgi:hypothetical protein